MLKQNRKIEKTAYLLVCLLIECLCLWIAFHTPYGVDDWAWGVDYGMEKFLTGGLNSRYVGNLLEIIVTRSFFLKVLLHGTLGMLLPVASASMIGRVTATGTEETESGGRRLTLLLLSAAGGSLAMLLTMLVIRHKTRHIKFMLGIPIIMLFQGIVLWYIFIFRGLLPFPV